MGDLMKRESIIFPIGLLMMLNDFLSVCSFGFVYDDFCKTNNQVFAYFLAFATLMFVFRN